MVGTARLNIQIFSQVGDMQKILFFDHSSNVIHNAEHFSESGLKHHFLILQILGFCAII